MTDKKDILAELTERFSSLGTELGFSSPITRTLLNPGRETHVFMVRNGHALQMEILWYDFAVLLYAVRLIDGGNNNGFIDYTYLDGSWAKAFVDDIYHLPPKRAKKTKKLPGSKTWDTMAPYFYRSLDKQLELIRNNPDILLSFMNRIDSSPMCPPL